mgnify:CR=1 FL=1
MNYKIELECRNSRDKENVLSILGKECYTSISPKVKITGIDRGMIAEQSTVYLEQG